MHDPSAADPDTPAVIEPVAAVLKKPVPLWRKLLPLIGLVLLAWVLSKLDLNGMRAAIARVSTPVLVMSSASFMFNALLKAARWQGLLRAQGIVVPARVTLAAFLSGQFYGQVTLGRVGEFFRVEALLERGVSAGAALASSVFDRVLDLFLVLLVGGVLGALVLGNTQLAALAFAVMAGGAFGIWSLLSSLGAPDSRWAARFRESLAGGRGFARLPTLVHDLAQGIYPMVRPAPLWRALGWTLISWFFYYNALFVLADGLGLHVSRVLLTATAAAAALSALLPITISGLGARELIYVAVLQRNGVPGEVAAVLSLLHLFVMTISAIGFGLLGVIWRQRQKSA